MSTADNRNVLVVVTADDCGYCTAFKSNGLLQLQKELQTSGIVRVIHINKKSMKSLIEPPYPTQLNSLAIWYPTFILINGKAWNNNFSESKNMELPVEIFNGVYKDGTVTMDHNRKGFDKLVSWITDNIENNPKFKVFTATASTIITKPAEEKESKEQKKIVYIATCGSLNLKVSSRR